MDPVVLNNAATLTQSWICVDKAHAPMQGVHESLLDPIEERVDRASHEVLKMELATKSDKPQVVFFKKCDVNYPPLLAQMEAAASASYRIVKGVKAAKVRPVFNDSQEVIGAISYELRGFLPLLDHYLSFDQLIDLHVADELVARYIRQEDDLNPNNIGFCKTFGIVGIDYDMSFYPLSSKLKGARLISGIVAPKPEDAFPITQSDLKHFPNISDAKPCYWPTRVPSNLNLRKAFQNPVGFQRLEKDLRFQNRKFFAFLKELLINPKTHTTLIRQNFSSTAEAGVWSDELVKRLEKRYKELEYQLIQHAPFRKFILTNRNILKNCVQHFKNYNKREESLGVKFDISWVIGKYYRVVKRCMVKDITEALYELGFKLRTEAGTDQKLKKDYQFLIQTLIEFRDSKVKIEEAFFILDSKLRGVSSFFSGALKIKDQYGKLIAQTKAPLSLSFFVDRERSQIQVHESSSRIKPIKPLMQALKQWLLDPQNKQEIITLVKKAYEQYRPVGQGTFFESINPLAYFRTRSDSFETLISALSEGQDPYPLIIKFISEGGWNSATYITESSANVLLISHLSLGSLETFKENLSLEQLIRHELLEVVFCVKKGDLKLEDQAESIGKALT